MNHASHTGENYSLLEARIAAWATGKPDLRAGVIVGSRGRPDETADEWSDLDLIFFTPDTDRYLNNRAWLADFGELWASYLDATADGYPEIFALYAGGLKVDIVYASLPDGMSENLEDMLANFTFQDVIRRGLRVLFDKTGARQVFPVLPGAATLPPLTSSEPFEAAVQRFWIKAVKAAKLVRRGDLWRAKQACDCELKECLLEMLEWHARLVYKPSSDTWYEGRFVEAWADPDALAALPKTFAAYGQDDLRRALLATITLYDRLAGVTAAVLRVQHPLPEHEKLRAWLEEVLC